KFASSRSWKAAFAAPTHVVDGVPVLTHPLTGSHEFWVQAKPSSQSIWPPGAHVPWPSHVSAVQTFWSTSQGVPEAAWASAGHVALGWPVQRSATSHTPFADRHTVPAGVTTSDGHGCPAMPGHRSDGSHASPDPVRQTTVGLATTSAGHPCP